METTKVKFSSAKNDSFDSLLKERIANYFSQHNNNDKANVAMIIKMVFIGILFVGTYILMLSNRCSEMQLLFLALLWGASKARLSD